MAAQKGPLFFLDTRQHITLRGLGDGFPLPVFTGRTTLNKETNASLLADQFFLLAAGGKVAGFGIAYQFVVTRSIQGL